MRQRPGTSHLADLERLLTAHGSDKAAHGYHMVYATLLSAMRLCDFGFDQLSYLSSVERNSTMAFTTMRTETSRRGIATVTLDRPGKLNAFDQTMLDELATHVRQLAADAGVRVLVLRAAGKHFSSGADMVRPKEESQRNMAKTGFVDLFLTIESFPKPSIAVVQGACVGGAVALVACCDLVLAADNAFFSIPEVRIGVAPIGVTPVLVRAIGLRNYRRHALSGERFSAAHAQRNGLVDEVHAAERLDGAVEAAAEAFLLGAPGALSDLKEHLLRAYPALIDELKAAQARHARVDSFKSPEALEGVAAFKARRKPAWYPPR